MKNFTRILALGMMTLSMFAVSAIGHAQTQPPTDAPAVPAEPATPANPPAEENPLEQFDLLCFVVAQQVQTFMGVKIERGNPDGDIMIVYLQDGDTKAYGAVLAKGQFEKDIEAGALDTMLMGQTFTQDNGVLRDAAMLNLKLNELNDIYEGILIAKGNAYPLVCPRATLKVPEKTQPSTPSENGAQ